MPVGSKPLVGSSKNRKSGSPIKAIAIAKRCFMPREKFFAFFLPVLSSLMIQVDRIPEACSILENVVGTKNYTVNPDGTISLFDHLDEAGLINTILAKHDIIVNSISMSNADLENYFIQVTGGDR